MHVPQIMYFLKIMKITKFAVTQVGITPLIRVKMKNFLLLMNKACEFINFW